MLLLSLLDHVKQVIASPFESKPQAQTQGKGVNAMDSSSTGSTAGTTGSASEATITANDFLTLLVTEIQNQDPTQQTDPMQYITQLVGVNSLEQLVEINQTLTTATGTGTTPTSHAASSATAVTAAAKSASPLASTTQAAAAGHLLPLGSNVQLPTSSETAVAQAFTHASALPTQVLPPTQVPLNPEVMRALEHSIPGATLSGSSLPALGAAGAGGAIP